MRRRERWDILGRILEILQKEATHGEPAVLTRIAQSVNVPYDRFVDYLDELRAHGLVSAGEAPAVTPKGEEVLRSWRQWAAVLQRFGFD